MNEESKGTPGNRSLTKEASVYDRELSNDDLVQGIKMARYLDSRVQAREKEIIEAEKNPVEKIEEVIPTVSEIDEEMYR